MAFLVFIILKKNINKNASIFKDEIANKTIDNNIKIEEAPVAAAST